MNPIQEAKQELEASIRYAENAIANAKQTIEQAATYQEQTGREAALEAELQRQKDLGQGYYDSMMTLKQQLEEAKTNMALMTDEAEFYKKSYTELEVSQGKGVPTMPVIPKAVAIAIFREGVQHGVEAACTELDNAADICIEEHEYYGHFEVSFTKEIDLCDHVDTDWMRGKCGDYSEETIIDALGTLCADKEFECRIHGVDDNPAKE